VDDTQLSVITGGSRGIGHHLVQSFLETTSVLNISRKPARKDASLAGHELHNLNLDLENVAHIESSLNGWLDDHPHYKVTTLVLNAAATNLGWLDSVSCEEFENAFRVNVHAPLVISTALYRAGRFAPAGARVVYVVSSLGRVHPELSFAGLGLYSMTKAALSRAALIQAREFALTAPHIKVLRIHPGIVDTDIQRELRRDARLDPAFASKTAGLPPYQEGEWRDRSPKDNMRTIPAKLAADFIVWAIQSETVADEEYDFYHVQEFHTAFST
jgi:NAD(P)-dependent dehydrogenase (short-subunit alcohol dehydrogenase family)